MKTAKTSWLKAKGPYSLMEKTHPLLTIAIPTYNRAFYLKRLLDCLAKEISPQLEKHIEVIVCNNDSSDATNQVLIQSTLTRSIIQTVTNERNVGSDVNIAQCFKLARGQYVLILGDDDMPLDGALSTLVSLLKKKQYGVLYLRTFGFNKNMNEECPKIKPGHIEYSSSGEFLTAVGQNLCSISACVINKHLIADIEPESFCGENLVQVHLCIIAATRASLNLRSTNYMMGLQRNNSGGYEFCQVFVTNFFKILETYLSKELTTRTITRIEKKFLVGFYPYYILRALWTESWDMKKTLKTFTSKFSNRVLFWIVIWPALVSPRYIAIPYIGVWTVFGRLLYGDFKRGISYLVSKISRKISRASP
jgi:glycosyltransferase involved in cell wall biosynthesis